MKQALRLAILNSHPIQYFAPLYAFLARESELEISVLYCSDFSLRGATDPGFRQPVSWDVDLLVGYRSVFLGQRSNERTPNTFWSLICPEVWREVRQGGYDAVVLHGYGYAVNIIAFLAAKSKKIPVIMRSETHLGLQRRGWKLKLRDSVLAQTYRLIDGFLAIGSANREYYRSIRVPERKIFDVPYSVDNDRFIAAASSSPAQRRDTRRRFGLPSDGLVVLYASKFEPRKHPHELIRAMAELNDRGRVATLFLVGGGEMDEELRALASSLVPRRVVFGGFVNQSELPLVYAASDVFVLPSENEPWGLVVNEAMCAGLPVVVSDEVGCVADLVEDGVNGFRVTSGDVSSLVVALERLLADSEQRERMGLASRAIIDGWSYEQCRQGILAAVKSVTAVR